MKTIEYCGVVFEVEDKYKFVVADPDGAVFAYTHKPYYKSYEDGYLPTEGDTRYMGNVNTYSIQEV